MDIAAVNRSEPVTPAVMEPQQPTWLVENRHLVKTVKQINASELFGGDRELTFGRDQDTHRPVIRVVNRQTRQVMMQLPPDYVLELARSLDGKSNSEESGASADGFVRYDR
ncbi:MAG: flagellar protein FlaG [Bryobacteraceae bacterium]